MKRVIILTFLLAISYTIFGQNLACSSLRKGTFKLTSKVSGTTIISRTDSLQIEENIEHGFKAVFDITWINPCTYELRAKEIIKGDPSLLGNKGDVITVQIKEIKNKSYVIETKANFSDLVLTTEIEVL